MFNTATPLKANIANLSAATGIPHIVLQRRYMLDRFLERLSCSPYRDFFILKGGILISGMVGIAARATQDLDATVKGLPLMLEDMRRVIDEIAATDVGDQISFTISSAETIMEEAEYEGVRFGMRAKLQNMTIPIKIDIITGDAITPEAIAFDYKLMFEGRHIDILAYPIETVLAEKIESMIVRADANSRMRDFYDMHILYRTHREEINATTLEAALKATAAKRKTTNQLSRAETILTLLDSSDEMKKAWKQYQKAASYAAEISWQDVMRSVRKLCNDSGLLVNRT